MNQKAADSIPSDRLTELQHINLQLTALGLPAFECSSDHDVLAAADSMVRAFSEQRRLLAGYQCPADQRIQDFLNTFLREQGVDVRVSIPETTFVLDQPGLARTLSLPLRSDHFSSDYVDSYRLRQGVLHNPVNDRRTTQGVFHIVAGGLPVPSDKLEVPAVCFARLFEAALDPPQDLLRLPLTSEEVEPAHLWVSLLMRPLVHPGVEGVLPHKSLETRFFAPGGLVANLDFVESIFGNAGDPHLTENDAALDIEHWTGHTGCVILAPHLVTLPKQALGLPHYDDATDRQRRDGMCWKDSKELYNGGTPFKVVCRDRRGVIVTLIADNYFGYSKKEIKSQISYSANLFGGCEEEHSGGALAFPRFNLGERYLPHGADESIDYNFERLCEQLQDTIERQSSGYAVDRRYPDIIYIPENASIDLQTQRISWKQADLDHEIKLLAHHSYIYPSGFRVDMQRHPHAPSWRLVGTLAEGTFCHKPSTVSGGGKSEISKSIAGSVISGPVFVADIDADLDAVEAIFNRDYSTRFRDPHRVGVDRRSLLSPERTLGSVIKLLTPSKTDYNSAYNAWLERIPQHILALVFMIKRFYQPKWGKDWRRHFSVDRINGYPGKELKYRGRRLVASYLRVGFENDGAWRVFKLRQDYIAAEKVQMEDDITASTVIPVDYVSGLDPSYRNPSIKLAVNCEQRLFQRPDDAVNRGADAQTEADLSGRDNFISNFQPLSRNDARELIEDAMHFEEFSHPMQNLIESAARDEQYNWFVSSAHPRLVGGKPSPNMRYLQLRPDVANPRTRYLAEVVTRLARGLNTDQPVYFPVNAVLQGRRNNPANQAAGIRPLAVYNPIHYQELPELFMDYICSLTGKSPSTTGAGSEGALTKGPFNPLFSTADLNTALVSFILCGYHGFSTPAGHIGAQHRVDHDISLLVPEIWCRLPVAQREPGYMIEQGFLEKLDDFEFKGRTIAASRLGYRITERFVHANFGKIFDSPTAVFDQAMLRPETQDLESFVDGIDNIVDAQKRVAAGYFEDGSIADACPPLQALLHIMVDGEYRGLRIDDPGIREMFTRDYLLQSDWYRERLAIKQRRDVQLWKNNITYLEQRLAQTDGNSESLRTDLSARIQHAQRMFQMTSSREYLARLQGTLGADWLHREPDTPNA